MNTNFSIRLPELLFKTQNRFNDASTDDMKYGDLDERELKNMGLKDISFRVDPYNLIQYNFPRPLNGNSSIFGMEPHIPAGRKISKEQCADILFDEMKFLSGMFSHGKYAKLINLMIDHLHYSKGASFSNNHLSLAYSELIYKTRYKNPLSVIEKEFNAEYGRVHKHNSHLNVLDRIKIAIRNTVLPKFNQLEDSFNGLGITIHDIHAQEIKLVFVNKYSSSWGLLIDFKAQDHFGLDCIDESNLVFHQFRFFRIWFFLQRHRDFAYKPFFTNFNASIWLEGRM